MDTFSQAPEGVKNGAEAEPEKEVAGIFASVEGATRGGKWDYFVEDGVEKPDDPKYGAMDVFVPRNMWGTYRIALFDGGNSPRTYNLEEQNVDFDSDEEGNTFVMEDGEKVQLVTVEEFLEKK